MPSARTATAPRDFVAVAKAYAKKALDPKHRKRFGVWMRSGKLKFGLS